MGAGEASERRWGRPRLPVKEELLLALLPTVIVLAVLGLLEAFSEQRLLFASLASSAFLIKLAPLHTTNTARTLAASHVIAAGTGLVAFLTLGHDYPAAEAAMVGTTLSMVLSGVTHPPAVSISLIFALCSGAEAELLLFGLALAMVVALVLLQRAATCLLAWCGDELAPAEAAPAGVDIEARRRRASVARGPGPATMPRER